MIELRPANSGGYRAYWGNGCYSGDVYREVDGYYVWLPPSLGGIYSAHFLQSMANRLFELNQEWDAQVRRDTCGPSAEGTGPDYVPSTNDSVPWEEKT